MHGFVKGCSILENDNHNLWYLLSHASNRKRLGFAIFAFPLMKAVNFYASATYRSSQIGSFHPLARIFLHLPASHQD
jgi:hypothetical protein